MKKVFVYGSLKRGLHNHRLLESSAFLGKEVIKGWDMFSLTHFPAITQGDDKVHGEVYEVDDFTFKRLDQLEAYPEMYDRVQVETIYGTCWVYFMTDPPKHVPVENGIWENPYKEDI